MDAARPRPSARDHRAPLRDDAERRRLAGGDLPPPLRGPEAGPPGGAAPDDRALPRPHARERAGATSGRCPRPLQVFTRDQPHLERRSTRRVRFCWCGDCSTPSFWNSARRWVLMVPTLTNSSAAMSALVAGLANRSFSLWGRHSTTSTARWASVSSGTGSSARTRVALDSPRRAPQNTTVVFPKRSSSPSRRRCRPERRWPLTNDPFEESPSSAIVQSSPSRSSSACSRDTSSSQSSARSLVGLRPTAPGRGRRERHESLPTPAVAKEQERYAAPLRLEPLLELRGPSRVGSGWRAGHRQEKPIATR